MSEKPSDNRRRISPNLLQEIEEFDGKDFSERLLKWKNDSDSSSSIDYDYIEGRIEKEADRIIESLKN